jgi:hypothetical protein
MMFSYFQPLAPVERSGTSIPKAGGHKRKGFITRSEMVKVWCMMRATEMEIRAVIEIRTLQRTVQRTWMTR